MWGPIAAPFFMERCMTVDELIQKTGGYFLANKVYAMVDGVEIVAAAFDGPELVLTDAGRKALNRATSDDAEVKPTRARKSKPVAQVADIQDLAVDLDAE